MLWGLEGSGEVVLQNCGHLKYVLSGRRPRAWGREAACLRLQAAWACAWVRARARSRHQTGGGGWVVWAGAGSEDQQGGGGGG